MLRIGNRRVIRRQRGVRRIGVEKGNRQNIEGVFGLFGVQNCLDPRSVEKRCLDGWKVCLIEELVPFCPIGKPREPARTLPV